MRRRYLSDLQDRIDAHASDFKKCGLAEKRRIAFKVSPFGTLPFFEFKETFNILGTPVDEKVKECIARHLESLLEPPHDLNTDQPMSAVIPVQ